MSETPSAHDASPAILLASVPPIEISLTPLDLTEPPPIRSKLRLYAILLALYVFPPYPPLHNQI